MPDALGLILTFTGGLAAAWLFGVVTHRLRLSPIVGYLAAGIAVGPFSPGFVADRHLAEQLAEIGVVLLMFGVGLQFHGRELLAVWRLAVPGAVAQIAIATLLGVLVTAAFGWSIQAGIVFGLAISVASTVVLVRVLADHDALHTPSGHVAVGWLLVEDVFTVVLLVLLPTVAAPDDIASPAALAASVGGALLKLAALVAFTWIVGRRAIPMLLKYVERTRSRELFTLTVLVVALGIAVGSALLFGASMALGAFLAGIVVGRSEFSTRAASEALPMRDAFAVLFFVAIGMLFDPAQLATNWPLTLATVGVILIGKPLAAFVAVIVLRHSATVAVAVAIALAQIGEFSFIVAALAQQLEVLPADGMQAIVAASIISITLNPFLFRFAPALGRWAAGVGGLKRVAGRPAEGVVPDAIVVGYGPVGRTLVRVLRDQSLTPVVVELNLQTVQRVRREGIAAVHGDASRPEVLEAAGVAHAQHLVLTASTPPEAVIRVAKSLRSDLIVITRAAYLTEVVALRRAGADVAVSAEGELALALAEALLESLGATREQLDRTRDRVLTELIEPLGRDVSERSVPGDSSGPAPPRPSRSHT